MNAISILIEEHNQFKKMLEKLSDNKEELKDNEQLLSTLFHELLRHETMEQTVWYPKLKAEVELSSIIEHLISEEKDANKLITKFKKIKALEEKEKMFLELKQDILHHAKEEEKNLFPKVEKFFSQDKLEQIGKEMDGFKKDYEKSLAA